MGTEWRPKTADIPASPGVYRFRDQHGTVIYVGKAKHLRNRLTSYFADPRGLHPRTRKMVRTAKSVDWVVVDSEVESLQLEHTWINEYEPRFNVRFKDDKSYPWLAITLGEAYPRVMVVRGKRRKGWRYFGPFVQAWSLRASIDKLLKVYPVRTCSDSTFRTASNSGRPCLLAHIDKCSAPCVGRVVESQHAQYLDGFIKVFEGKAGALLRQLKAEMAVASDELDFERAATLRDRIAAIESVGQHTKVVLEPGVDVDLVGLAHDELAASVQVFHVRDGHLVGQRSFLTDCPEDSSEADLMSAALLAVYASGEDQAPKEVLLSNESANHSEDALLLSQGGAAVQLRVPSRGDKAALMETVVRNAVEALNLYRSRRGADLAARGAALEELGKALGLEQLPLRIEAVDISHLDGAEVVGSLVVFEDGMPLKRDYRHFVLRHGRGNNDVASIAEVVHRRFESKPEAAENAKRFSYPPNLLVIDGGRPQVVAAMSALSELGVELPVIGLAKRLEEVWVAGQDHPLLLARNSDALFLLQRVRDEAHRFAISHQRKRVRKSAIASLLDEIPGLGPKRKQALLAHFGSVKALRAADQHAIAAVPGIGAALAAVVVAALDTQQPEPGVNTATGELL